MGTRCRSQARINGKGSSQQEHAGIKTSAPTINDGLYKSNDPQSRAALQRAEGAKNISVECQCRPKEIDGERVSVCTVNVGTLIGKKRESEEMLI